MSLLPGVVSTESGYANSSVPHPYYQQVCSGLTDAAETVRVTYNPAETSLEDILAVYFMSIDPTSVNRQGADVGTQYRTGIYYTDPSQLPAISNAVERVAKEVGQPLAVEVLPLQNFYPAEDYHQKYLEKNPRGYCHISPRLLSYAKSLKNKSSDTPS